MLNSFQNYRNVKNVDIIINNSGGPNSGLAHLADVNEYMQAFKQHVVSAQSISQVGLPFMKKKQFGRIINIISTAGIWGNFGQAAYASAKSGLIGLTRVAALDLQRTGITCNAIAPFASTRVTIIAFAAKTAGTTYPLKLLCSLRK